MEALEQHLSRQLERSRDFFWNRLRWELVYEDLESAERVVDVGAGPGFLGEYLADRRPGLEYWFVEPIAELEQRLVERFGTEANRRDRDFAGASHVTLMDVLEHQEDDRAFMADLVERMDPGATLLLTVPAMPFLWSNWDTMLGHYKRYTKESLREAVGSLPLAIEEESYLFPELIPAGLARRRRMRNGSDGAEEAEFPELSKPVNETLYRVGRATMRWRNRWPAGTSLFAKLRHTGVR
ncbi:MAG: class I SAM-dependent methyltransferase [Actinomycetota bacterium]|nr:class I SAM-dependent methyltransferase [Actinomycetota bacterium]